MKVAFYNHTSVVSGAEISLLLTARHLTAAEPVLFAPEGELLDRAKESGLQAVPVPGYRARVSRNPVRLAKDVFGMMRAGWGFAQAVRRHGIDLIHANSLRAGLMAASFRWLHRRPIVWHVRDNLPRGPLGAGIRGIAAWGAQALIGISGSVLDGLRTRALEKKLRLVHNGVELRPYSEREKGQLKQRIREELRTPQIAQVIAIIGQIAPWKRQEDAVSAFNQLLIRGNDAYLWVVGEAKFREENQRYEAHLKRMAEEWGIADRVRFTGFREDVMEICCAADLLFLCSDNEPFGRVIIEAMSQAVPVVATKAGGVPEIIDHDVSGMMYEVGDTDELARIADRLLRHDGLRRQLGVRGEERVIDHFTIQATAAKVEEVYRSVLGSRALPAFPYAKEEGFS